MVIDDRDAFWGRRGRLLGHGPDLSGDSGVDIDRITLRTLLAEAVGDDPHLGRAVSAVGHDEDGTRQVRFTDAAPVTADLVVGADGAGASMNAPGNSGSWKVANIRRDCHVRRHEAVWAGP
ncbi:hypothetical protein ABTY53_25735 [Streptomyces noursei]|uniref:hypothetical protein n=1 Tax=Streptomyces noursei TaxID=1971 RepID=UPI0033268003